MAESFSYATVSEAIRRNDAPALKRLLRAIKKGAALLPADAGGVTALHLAASKREYRPCLALMLEQGAGILDFDVRSEDGDTALMRACDAGLRKSALLLLRAGCDPNAGTDASSPLHLAATHGHSRIVEHLIYFGARVNGVNIICVSVLHHAAEGGHLDICRTLLENGANVSVADICGITPLHSILECKHFEDTLFVWDYTDFSLLNRQDDAGRTPFMAAAKSMPARGVRYLLEHGGRTDVYDENGMSALHHAAKVGRTETFRLLLRRADPSDYRRFCLGSFPFTGLPDSRKIFTSLTNCVLSSRRFFERLNLLLTSGLPKSILQMPSVERPPDYNPIVYAPVTYFGIIWMHLEEPDKWLQSLAKHKILTLDEFNREFRVKWPQEACFGHPFVTLFTRVIDAVDRGTEKRTHLFNLLCSYGVTTDYCLQAYCDTAQPFAAFTAFDRYYRVVMNAVKEDNVEGVALMLVNSVILEPEELLVCMAKWDSTREEQGSDEMYRYLISLKPIYYMRVRIQQRCQYNYWPRLMYGDTEEFSRVTLRQLCRTAVREQLREPSLEDNLRNFRRKILELPLPNSLKDYLLFKS